ncbi:MAG TPA: hypothetical protein VMB80_14855 [Candidatus Acidoferrum sp.]|nr:hypothetical protein [Candidatus Acidoferrum sp.]
MSPALAQTWTQTSAPTNNWVSIASSADGAKLVAVVNPGGIWVSSDSGSTWTQTSAPRSQWSRVVSSADGNTLAALGTPTLIGGFPTNLSYTGSFYTSTDSGMTWMSNNIPYLDGGNFSYPMTTPADGCKLAAIITYLGLPGNATLFTSTNLGVAWTTNKLPTGSWNVLVGSADGTKLLAAGGEILISTNWGSGWLSTNSFSYVMTSVAESADATKCFAAAGSWIFISTNSGATWEQTSAPASNRIALASSADGYRVVALAQGSGAPRAQVLGGPIYTSADGGRTWSSNQVTAHNWVAVTTSADGCKLFAADAGQPITPLPPYTTAGGGIWTAQIPPTSLLNLQPTNGSFVLSWTIPSTNFVLQQSADLSGWSGVTNPPVLNLTNLQNEVVLSPTNASGFYRLKTP